MTSHPAATQADSRSTSEGTSSATGALVLALLSVPGSILTWDTLPGGGFVWGAPLAVAAIMLARGTGASRGRTLAAILIAGAMLAMMAVWTVVEKLG